MSAPSIFLNIANSPLTKEDSQKFSTYCDSYNKNGLEAMSGLRGRMSPITRIVGAKEL